VLIETKSDRILGFTMFGAGAGDVMAAVQMAMLAGLPYTAVRDAILTHPTMPEGLASLFSNVPPIKVAMKRGFRTREEKMALA
jgi:pyruvate/2-oxoglutarate dehydrogenase complex dihydrolipoamide dehydrogenase (E3) component